VIVYVRVQDVYGVAYSTLFEKDRFEGPGRFQLLE
jgi:hypothetical protein